MLVFLNGQFVPEPQAVVSVNDRGFMYGDGLFETLRVCAGRPFRLAQHLERMMRGADFLKIKCPFTPKDLHEFANRLIEQNQMPEAILRVVLTADPENAVHPPSQRSANVGDDVTPRAAAGRAGDVEPHHLDVPHSRRGSAGIVQDLEQVDAHHGAQRGRGAGRGRSIAGQNQRRSRRSGKRQSVLGFSG